VALTRWNDRQHRLAVVSFVNVCERAAVGVRSSSAVKTGDGCRNRWVTFPSCPRIIAVVSRSHSELVGGVL
jgi:hypothetical protein